MPNSWHRAPNFFSFRLAATTNCTRCSCTSIVFQAMLTYTPALAALARECKGCPETFCKGCHETEHVLCEKWGFSQPDSPAPLCHSDRSRTSSEAERGRRREESAVLSAAPWKSGASATRKGPTLLGVSARATSNRPKTC